MLASAAALLIGIARDDVGPIGLSLAAAVAAIVLVWIGVVRSSGPTQRDRDG
ncbi:MAG TPA: hypothetical protein VFT80_06870 [Actinomycetota bacterium]|nr:hypothetical protein [Actinomycetota bacterium]